MPRATNAPASRRRRKRILQEASGFRGRRSKLYRYAKDAVYKARQWAYRDRKNRKRNFRMLWITRINNACRLQGLTYSRFMEGLRTAGIELNRKMMAELAVAEDGAFKAIFDASMAALKDKPTATLKAA